jgi:transketolase
MKKREANIEKIEDIANRIRIHVVKMIAQSGVGHVGGSMSIAEIISVLYFYELNIRNLDCADRDRFVLSKGHGCPAFYAVLSELGYVDKKLLATLHEIDSPFQMHPEYGCCPGVEMSTGALGQGLSAGIGMALGARIQKKTFRVYVLIGDGESNEGQVWEAALCAGKFKLDNLTAVLDYNKFALSDRVSEVMPLEPVVDKWKSFGWHVIEADGHSVKDLIRALDEAREIKNKPCIIVAHTVKGFRVASVADQAKSHSVSFTKEQVVSTLEDLGVDEAEIEQVLSQMEG